MISKWGQKFVFQNSFGNIVRSISRVFLEQNFTKRIGISPPFEFNVGLD